MFSGIRSAKAGMRAKRERSFAAAFAAGKALASTSCVDAGGRAGADVGVVGGAASFAERAAAGGAAAVAAGAGGADAVAVPVGGAEDGSESAGEGDGTGAGGVGGVVASWDGRMIRFSTKELTDAIAASACWRAALTSATYPEICRPVPTKPRTVLTSIKTITAITRNRMGCCSG
jgi:hypothetical protein